MTSAQINILVQTYLYTIIGALAAAAANGQTTPKELLIAAVVAVLGPIVKAANPKDKSVGIGAAKLILQAAEEASKDKTK